jgi:Ala-tRNA(Pro) deacylase
MKIPTRLLDFLNQHNVRYEIVHHPLAYTAQELAAIEGVKGREHAKVVVVQMPAGVALAVLPADRRIDWKRLGAVGLAAEAVLRHIFADCELGTMPPFGHLYGVMTYLDRSLAENDRIIFEAGTHSDAIQMSYPDYERLAQVVLMDFTTPWNG